MIHLIASLLESPSLGEGAIVTPKTRLLSLESGLLQKVIYYRACIRGRVDSKLETESIENYTISNIIMKVSRLSLVQYRSLNVTELFIHLCFFKDLFNF